MLRSYLKLAWKVLWRRKFFTAISLFGISFTLVVLMVATALSSTTSSRPTPPEVRQDRTLGIYRARMTGDAVQVASSMPGYTAAGPLRPGPARRRTAGDLRHARRTVYSYQGGQRIKLAASSAPTPSTGACSTSGSSRAGRSPTRTWPTAPSSPSSTRPRGTASSAARRPSGRTIEADGQHFRVIGVVPDVPILRPRRSTATSTSR